MKDCWKSFELSPISDTRVIRQSYLRLVKKYHPDTVHTPEQKRKFTIRCAEINSAYEEALKRARFINTPEPQPTSGIIVEESQPWYANILMYIGMAIGLIIPIAGIVWLLNFGVPEIRSLSDTNIFRVAFTSLVVSGVAFLIIGLGLMGILDMLIAFFFPTKLLAKLGLEKYESKLIWLTMLGFNIYIFYFTDFGSTLSGMNDTMAVLYAAIWRTVGAGTIPFLLALDWIKDVLKYQRIKNRDIAVRGERSAHVPPGYPSVPSPRSAWHHGAAHRRGRTA